MREYSFVQPKTMDELFQAVAEGAGKTVRFVAGGTDFMPRLHTDLDSLPKGDEPETVIVSLGGLGIDGISETGDAVKIGACAVLNDIAANPIVKKDIPALAETIEQIAGMTIRNIATIGGNIVNASPAADSIPILMALDATFVVAAKDGEKEIKACDFFTGPGQTKLDDSEILKEIVIPKKSGKAFFVKQGRRKAETLSTVNAAAYIEVDGGVCKAASIAVGSCAPTVVKCTKVEEALVGKELSDENIEAAAKLCVDMINPIDDVRSSAWYRNKIAPVMVKRAIKGSI